MRFLPIALLFATFMVTGCGAKPPPRWAEGGAPLVIAPARWDRGSENAVEIKPNGTVTEDGDPIFVIDRAGRVTDDDYEPVAVLLPDGHVAGTDNRLLGRVGVANAAPPEAAAAWIAILPNGQVLYFDEEGERSNGGVWHGCQGPQLRTCTLVTHMIAMRHWSDRHRGGVMFGVGIGVGL